MDERRIVLRAVGWFFGKQVDCTIRPEHLARLREPEWVVGQFDPRTALGQKIVGSAKATVGEDAIGSLSQEIRRGVRREEGEPLPGIAAD